MKSGPRRGEGYATGSKLGEARIRGNLVSISVVEHAHLGLQNSEEIYTKDDVGTRSVDPQWKRQIGRAHV